MSHFVLSCTTSCARQPFGDEILDCLEVASGAGFKYWALQGPVPWTRGLARWIDSDLINRLAEQAGLRGCSEVYGAAILTESREAALASARYVAHVFDLADRLKSPLVVITGRPRVDGGLEATLTGLQALLPLVKGTKVRLALEPHHGSQIMTRADYDQIMRAIDNPQIGITVDTGHFYMSGVDYLGLIRDHADRIYNVHLKDHIGDQSVPLGTGEIDLRKVVEVLHEVNYCGALAVELEVLDPQNYARYVAAAYRYTYDLVSDVTGQPPQELLKPA